VYSATDASTAAPLNIRKNAKVTELGSMVKPLLVAGKCIRAY
jgi:hypothetical protein